MTDAQIAFIAVFVFIFSADAILRALFWIATKEPYRRSVFKSQTLLAFFCLIASIFTILLFPF